MRKFVRAAGAALFLVLIAADVAFAQSAVAEAVDITIDLKKIVMAILEPISVAIGIGLAGYITKKLADLTGTKRDEVLAQRIEEGIKNGLALAQKKIESADLTVEVKNNLVGEALAYTATHLPGTIKKLGITEEALREKIEARLELNTVPADQSVAVPSPASVVEIKPATGTNVP